MEDDKIIICECGNEFEAWTSSGGSRQLFCPECGSDCSDEEVDSTPIVTP